MAETSELGGAATVEPPNSKPHLIVYSLDQEHSTYSMSMFLTKLHLRLRHAGIPYQNALGSRYAAPKKKIPYVQFTETGEVMGDSALIVEKLIKEGKLEDLNGGLSPEQKAVDYCLRVMIEDRVYYLVNYERWYGNYYAMRDKLFGHLPNGAQHVMGLLTFQFVKMMLYFQGTGRHNAEEVRHFTEEAVAAIAGFAESAYERVGKNGSGPFWILGGEKPTEADFTVFGALSGYLVNGDVQPVTSSMVRSHPALVDYIERIHGAYFADYSHLPCNVASWPSNI
ncbi:failed axon connections-like protein [Podospora aff. communis PSN243]|uniref:Failed axon connections-like protein n=1 Tax=Podospora aff. communis PSN243 TaxID=3040156 RepID=A0AAV9G083_9PEZI|nr:failed axon connections-like protein [Podospora aff. communis PSN243]